MKRASIFMLTLLFVFSLTACGSGKKENSLPKEGVIEKTGGDTSTSDENQTQPSSDGKKRMVEAKY